MENKINVTIPDDVLIKILQAENASLKAQVDRVKDIEALANIIDTEPHHGMPFDDCYLAAQAIQNYILGGEGGK